MRLYDLIVASAHCGLNLQHSSGYFPAGHNGSWDDEDTYVRTTAHWALLLYGAYKVTQDPIYRVASIKACDYLLTKDCRPFNYTFYCRKRSSGKNLCNGLIGQAWAVEPLVFFGNEIGNLRYLRTAEEVLLLHPYNRKKHLWSIIDIDGTNLGISPTLNQQIWFSALSLITGQLLDNGELNKRSFDFFSNVTSVLTFIEDGLISHSFPTDGKGLKSIFNKYIINPLQKNSTCEHVLINRSVGYLSFILYGFALAYRYSTYADFWANPELKRILLSALRYVTSRYPYGYLGRDFRWQYNPVGIEIAFVLETFQHLFSLNTSEEELIRWLSKQFEGYYDFEKNLMNRNTCDPNILSSRLYEAIRLKDYQLGINGISNSNGFKR